MWIALCCSKAVQTLYNDVDCRPTSLANYADCDDFGCSVEAWDSPGWKDLGIHMTLWSDVFFIPHNEVLKIIFLRECRLHY